ncbi:MAG: 50S ribosomal protein L19 [Chloroflexi bacterium]|nr:50S ribosomal protein L19 [Chloroflexota bacterium]
MRPGDTVRVHYQVVEGDQVRTQVLQGVVLRMTRGGPSANVTVRRVFQGIGVERTFLLASPRLERVEILRRGKVRRARLYYQRGLTGKKARIRERTTARPVHQDAIPQPEEPQGETS